MCAVKSQLRWWGGQSTLFVTLIDMSKHFTFLHLIDQALHKVKIQ